MRVLSVSEARVLTAGEKVPALKGVIKKMYSYASGKNEHGDWSIQKVILTDPSNPKQEIALKFFNHDEFPASAVGKTIYVESVLDDKQKLHGIEVVQDTYKWQQGDPLKFLVEVKKKDANAKPLFAFQDGSQSSQQSQPKPPPADSTTTNQPPASTRPAQAQPEQQEQQEQKPPPVQKSPEQIKLELFNQSKKHVSDYRKSIGRSINAFELIMDGVDHLAERRQKKGRAMTPEQFHGTCTTIYIQLQRGGMVDALPYDEVEQYLPPKKESSAPSGTSK